MQKFWIIFLLAILLLSGCGLAAATETPQATPLTIAQMLLSPDPNATATPTPFQPIAPTNQPTLKPTRTPTPKPTKTPLPPVPTLSKDAGITNILLLGSDQRPGGGYRTDVIVLVSLNPDDGTVAMISFPRDLYVFIPGIGNQRINTAQGYGGFSLMQATFEYNFGVKPDHYMLTNFSQFINIIDSLNGITIEASQELYDKCDLKQNRGGYCLIEPGKNTIDGATALWYVRSRYTTSDLDRTRRAQEVLIGIFNRLMSLKAASNAGKIYNQFKESVETDITLDDIVSLIGMAPAIYKDKSRIHRYSIGAGLVYDAITEGGAMVLVPNLPAVQALIHQAIGQ